MRMSVGITTLRFSRFQRGLKPWFGEAVLFAVVFLIAAADFTFMTFSVFTQTVERVALFTAGFFTAVAGFTFDIAFFTAAVIAVFTAGFFTAAVIIAVVAAGFAFDVAFFTAGFFTATVIIAVVAAGFAFDVAFFTAGFFTAGFFTAGFFTATVLGAVGRRVSSLVADSAGLIQERWTDDFSLGSGLVLHVVTCVFLFGTSGVMAHLAVWARSTLDGGGRRSSISGRRRHCIRLVVSGKRHCIHLI
jgi:hypothetical protein